MPKTRTTPAVGTARTRIRRALSAALAILESTGRDLNYGPPKARGTRASADRPVEYRP